MKKLLLSALLVAGAASYANAEEVVVFQDDFEWLAPWSKDKAGDTVACDNSEEDNKAPRLTDVVVDEKTAYDALVEKGYEFSFRYNPNLPEDKPDGYTIYLQRNYLKFNKTKNQNGLGYQAAMTLPAFENLPEDGKLNVSFDWCPMKQGDGKFDATQMAVFVINGVDTVEFKAPEHKWETGEAMSWTSAAVTIEGVKEGSKVMIRNTNEGWAVKTAQRWFIDNIKVAYDNAGGDTPEPGEGRVFFEDDFSWLAPWAEADQLGDPVGSNDANAKVVRTWNTSAIDGYNVFTYMTNQSRVGESAPGLEGLKFREEPGYLYRFYPNSESFAIFAANGYFQLGGEVEGVKDTGGLRIPNTNVPEDVENLWISFDWCPTRNALGEYPDTKLQITTRPSPKDCMIADNISHDLQTGDPFKWFHVEINMFDIENIPSPSPQFNVMIEIIDSQRGGEYWYYIDNIRLAETPTTGVNNIAVEDNSNAPVEYFNLQGVRVANPENGLYIRRQGNKATKVLVR